VVRKDLQHSVDRHVLLPDRAIHNEHGSILSISKSEDERKVVGMLAHDRPPRYGAYLLRYWQVRSDRPGQPSTRRFSLEEAGTGDRRGFRDLEALLAHMREELAAPVREDKATAR